MNVGEICTREVVFVNRETEVVEAAGLMRKHHVGSLVVVADQLSERRPVGIVTDRDIAISVVATDLDAKALTVGDIMSAGSVVIRDRDSIEDALRSMREYGVRRLPVVSESGALVGIVAIDDLVAQLIEDLDSFAQLVRRERTRESRARR